MLWSAGIFPGQRSTQQGLISPVGKHSALVSDQQSISAPDCDHGIPRGSVLGPPLFTLLFVAGRVVEIVRSFGIGSEAHADDGPGNQIT